MIPLFLYDQDRAPASGADKAKAVNIAKTIEPGLLWTGTASRGHLPQITDRESVDVIWPV